MTAHTPPTPPAAKERRPDRVDFVTVTASLLSSPFDDGSDRVELEELEDGMMRRRGGYGIARAISSYGRFQSYTC
jgi:hypothetical protein